MTAPPDWLIAFPVLPATEAVSALKQAWTELAARPLPHFDSKSKEPALTKKLKVYLDTHVSRQRGLLGTWSAEDIFGVINPATGQLTEERRTDIKYAWNDHAQNMQLVFEFKRLSRLKKDRDQYLREKGLSRFVTGIYSRNQSVAAMVGILLDPESEVVPPILAALDDAELAAALRLVRQENGTPVTRPSALFEEADFDTVHGRDAELAPSHGTIRVCHLFLSFGYPTATKTPKKRQSRRPSRLAILKEV